MKIALAACLAAAAALVACASSYSYSQIYGERYYKTAINTFPLIVLDVDGKSTTGQPTLVDPGSRRLRVQPVFQGAGIQVSKEVHITIEPCTRYWLVAVQDTRFDKDFEVKVDYKEPVPGCTPPTVANK
jgi:hypothetical protein